MYCFSVSVKSLFLVLVIADDPSKVELMTVLKSPLFVIVPSDKFYSASRNIWKKAGKSELGPKIFSIVRSLL